jgi:hypothetical protein
MHEIELQKYSKSCYNRAKRVWGRMFILIPEDPPGLTVAESFQVWIPMLPGRNYAVSMFMGQL